MGTCGAQASGMTHSAAPESTVMPFSSIDHSSMVPKAIMSRSLSSFEALFFVFLKCVDEHLQAILLCSSNPHPKHLTSRSFSPYSCSSCSSLLGVRHSKAFLSMKFKTLDLKLKQLKFLKFGITSSLFEIFLSLLKPLFSSGFSKFAKSRSLNSTKLLAFQLLYSKLSTPLPLPLLQQSAASCPFLPQL
jgi:hypothetical protein